MHSHGADPLPISKEYWKSEEFLKAFNGSYRTLGQLEPYMQGEERALSISIQEMMAKGQRKEALAKLNASPLSKTSAKAMFDMGNLNFELGEIEKAIEHYLNAIKKFPNFLRAHENLGIAYVRDGEVEKAFPSLTKALELGSKSSRVKGWLGYCYLNKGNYTSALQSLKSAQLLEPKSTEWKYQSAFCYKALGDFEKAVSLFKEVIKTDPDNADYVRQLADTYQRAGEYTEAIIQLEFLRRGSKLTFDDQLLLGLLHLSDGNKDLGVSLIRVVLKDEKMKDVDIGIRAANSMIQIRDLELAKEFYNLIKTEWITADNDRIYKRMGARLSILRKERVADAVKTLKGLIKTDPLDADSLYLLASVELTEGKKELAILHFDQAFKGEGEFKMKALEQKAATLFSLERYDEAIKALELYLKVEQSTSIKEKLESYKQNAEAAE
eukprot:Seg16229.1 transcript_id=Seg16229.1/GoldUCD/mRNA.D3Y31 product="putative UDP-N-acetylglucosamine-peptide N-acetylglucosaminyltransferase SEC" protein_id=Seg16229.1/GoldUCD/D3Y31